MTGGSASLGVRHTPTHSALPNWREPVAHPLTTRMSSNLGFRGINPLASPNLGGTSCVADLAPGLDVCLPPVRSSRLACCARSSSRPQRSRRRIGSAWGLTSCRRFGFHFRKKANRQRAARSLTWSGAVHRQQPRVVWRRGLALIKRPLGGGPVTIRGGAGHDIF